MKTVKQIIDEIRADIEIRPTPLDEQLDELLKSYESEIDGLKKELDDTCENLAWYINERKRLLQVIKYSKPNEGLQRTIRKALERPNGEWIACSDRLPEIRFDLNSRTSDTVFVCLENQTMHMAFYCDDNVWRFCESGEAKEPMWDKVVAWMPLPEPYKEEGGEE